LNFTKINFLHHFSFAIFLFSGLLKSIFKVFRINLLIDFTLLSWIITILFFLFVKKRNSILKLKNLFFALFIFYLWCLISSTYTSSDSYFLIKLRNIILNITSVLIVTIYYDKYKLKKFFEYFIIISTFLCLIFIYSILPFIYLDDLFYSVRAQYLTVSYLSGINLLYILTNSEIKLNMKYNKFDKYYQ
jgi:hypothetical protein